MTDHGRVVRHGTNCIWLILVASGCTEKEPPKNYIELRSASAAYLLGEPIQLQLTVQNSLNHQVVIPKRIGPPYSDGTDVLISFDNMRFKIPSLLFCSDCAIGPGITLQPKDSYCYTLAVPYSNDASPPLALDSPGTYFVKLTLPKRLRELTKNGEPETNTISVMIKKPDGIDVKVWDHLRDDSDMLGFLAGGSDDASAGKIADLLAAHPETHYRRSFRNALFAWCYSPFTDRDPAQEQKVRGALGMKLLREFNDMRLNHNVNIPVTKDLTVGVALVLLSRDSQVPLDASTELNAKSIDFSDSLFTAFSFSLEHYMAHLSRVCKAPWNRRGKGYVLSRE